MYSESIHGQRLVVLFLLGWLLFNFPLLTLFSRSLAIWGIPLLHLYLFGAWLLLIGMVALITARVPFD